MLPTQGRERLAADADPGRQPGHLHDPDDQGHRVRGLRRRSRGVHGDVRRRFDALRRSARSRPCPGPAAPPRSPGRPTSPRPRASTTAPAPASLTSFVSDATLTTSHQVELTGLAPDTTYYFRVTSSDGAANVSVSPDPPAAPASFTTPTAVATDTTVARLRRRHDRRVDLRVRHRRRRGHPRADGRCRVLRHESARRLVDRELDRRHEHRRRRRRQRRRLVDPLRHARAVRPSDRVRRHLQRRRVPERRVRGHPRRSRRIVGDVRHERDRRHPPGPDRGLGWARRRCRARSAVHRICAPLPHRVGYGRPLLHRRHPRPHRSHGRRDDAADRQRLRRPVATRCPSTGCG